MKGTFSAWNSVFTAVMLTAALAVPAPAMAQTAVPRRGGTSGGSSQPSGGGASPDGQSGSSAPRGANRVPPSGGGTRTAGGGTTVVTRDGSSSGSGDAGRTAAGTSPSTPSDPAPGASRPRDGQPRTGEAVARRSLPPSTGGGTTIFVPGGYYGNYYPWGYGGFGLGGYYGGYDDPWYYGGGYYGGGYQGYYRDEYEGQLRLKVKPRGAQVFVDGYFAGVVDDFDGVFQRLRIEPGPHRIEVRADDYEPLNFEVRILPDRTVTYTGELKKIRP